MRRLASYLLLFLGLLTLIGLIWHIGPARLAGAVAGLGAQALVVILLPSVLMYLLEAIGWRITLGRQASKVAFWRLFVIRTAGEVVNMTTPTAYIGGEPLKAFLLKRQGISMVDGLASVVTAKTTMTLAQVVFILIGIALMISHMNTAGVAGLSGSSNASVLAASAGFGLLLFGTALFVLVQRRGLFMATLGVLRQSGIRIPYLESREHRLRELDRTILEFYARDRRGFLLSTGTFFLGWLAEALEAYAILYYLGAPADLQSAFSIAALSVFIKGGTFFIPGSVGAQDGGNLMLLLAYGYTDVAGMTFALLRRLRELVWIVIGLVCLAILGGRRALTNETGVPRAL